MHVYKVKQWEMLFLINEEFVYIWFYKNEWNFKGDWYECIEKTCC
jgi:hypothetical protein